MRVEPALARATERTGCDPVHRQPGKAGLERRGVFQHDVRAFGCLSDVVLPQDRNALRPGEDQIAVLAKTDIGIVAELLLQPPEQAERELRQADVFADRELLADGGAGQCRGRRRELRVALDQRDRSGEAFLAQAPGDRGADNGSADDEDVELHCGSISVSLRGKSGSAVAFKRLAAAPACARPRVEA